MNKYIVYCENGSEYIVEANSIHWDNSSSVIYFENMGDTVAIAPMIQVSLVKIYVTDSDDVTKYFRQFINSNETKID